MRVGMVWYGMVIVFFVHTFFLKRCFLTSLKLSFSKEYQNFLISKQKKFLPHAGFEPGSLLNPSVHGTPYTISMVGIPRHVVSTISAFSFIILLYSISNVQGICGTLVEHQSLVLKVVDSSPGMICLGILFLYPAASD
jgi:hypothetical protein